MQYKQEAIPTNPSVHDSISNTATDRSAKLTEVLKAMVANPRVTRITIAVSDDACPAGQAVQGTYTKDDVLAIPLEACSRSQGCNCNYLPVLNDIFP